METPPNTRNSGNSSRWRQSQASTGAQSSISSMASFEVPHNSTVRPRPSTASALDPNRASRRSSKPSKVEAKAPPPCYVRCASSLVENSTFISLTTLLTIYALTGDDFRIIFTQKPADEYFNAMVLICIAIFSFEIIISVMGKSDYWLGFFFILDVVSTVTLVLDLTWINDLLAGNGDSSSLRSGRTARIGAKAARMIRVLRLVRILKLYKAWHEADRERARRRREAAMRASRPDDDEWDEHDDEALADAEENEEKEAGQESTLGKKLSEMTTRRVIILILAMLLILPLLQVDDFTQAPFSAEYGADQVMESFKDWDASGSSSDRVRYQNSMLTYVYYHNWYAGKGFWQYCPYSQVPSCSNGFWGHLYFVGIRGSNLAEVAAKASKARLNLTVVESFDEASKARDQAVYNLGSLPSQAQEWLAAAWTNDCPIISQNLEYLKGVSIIAEEGEGVYYPVTCPQDLRVTESLRYSPVWQTRQAFSEWRFEFYFDVRLFNRETAIFSLATTGFVLVLLLAGSLMFSRDANRLIVNPVEQMIRRVKAIRDNPLIAMQMADDEFKLEELRKYRIKRQGCVSRVLPSAWRPVRGLDWTHEDGQQHLSGKGEFWALTKVRNQTQLRSVQHRPC
ncbi:unnamed protein product [Durusdinium trenchii]|uniref:Ion transport domain-containing protein n=2 Tax=Durusdinium trenchii TaxID=1381693 RepID=A0ABP0QFK4_9DINO